MYSPLIPAMDQFCVSSLQASLTKQQNLLYVSHTPIKPSSDCWTRKCAILCFQPICKNMSVHTLLQWRQYVHLMTGMFCKTYGLSQHRWANQIVSATSAWTHSSVGPDWILHLFCLSSMQADLAKQIVSESAFCFWVISNSNRDLCNISTMNHHTWKLASSLIFNMFVIC